MKFLYIISILVYLLPGVLFGQSRLDTIKCWQANDSLSWKDFEGEIPISEFSTNKMAVCANEIIAKGYWDDDKPNFKVSVYFLKELAWAKDTLSISALAHEQLHFDIGELFARKIRKKIKELRCDSELRSSLYGDYILKSLAEKEEMNLRYDQETAHGIYEFKQKEWQQCIAHELDMLSDYASTDEDCIE